MNYTFQRLSPDHVDILRSLNQLFAEVFEDPQSYQSRPPSGDYLAAFLQDPQHLVLVALQDHQVIGGLVAYLLSKYEQERSEVYLYDLAVARPHQRQGVGAGLVRQLQVLAADLGAYVVFVQADEGDDAIEFYRALGPAEDLSTRNFDFPAHH